MLTASNTSPAVDLINRVQWVDTWLPGYATAYGRLRGNGLQGDFITFPVEKGQLQLLSSILSTEEYAEDVYCSLMSGFVAPANMGSSKICPELQAAYKWQGRSISVKKKENVSALCAVYSDLDIYSEQIPKKLTIPEVIARLYELIEAGEIPHYSLLIYSGRGIWPVWLLCDDSRQSIIHVNDNNRSEMLLAYENLERIIYEKLRDCGADPACKDPSRWVRVPDTVNKKSGERVRYVFAMDDQGQAVRYTITELAEFWGINPDTDSTTKLSDNIIPVPWLKDESRPRLNSPHNFQRTGRSRMKQFIWIAQLRQGIKEGARNQALLFYGTSCFQAGHSFNETKGKMMQFGLNLCDPPLADEEISKCQRQIKKLYGAGRLHPKKWQSMFPANQTIFNALALSDEELRLMAYKGLSWGAQWMKDKGLVKKNLKQYEFLNFLDSLKEQNRVQGFSSFRILSPRDMAVLFKQLHPDIPGPSWRTLQRWYKDLNLETGKTIPI